MATVKVDAISKVYDTPNGKETAVDGVSFEVDDDEFLTLVGPSGCGKTTTMRCIAGLESPTNGDIFLDGEKITDQPPNKRDIAMMFQSIALYPHMTVRENIGYPLKVDHVPKEDRREPVDEAASIMQITDMLDKYPGDLSGGQQQRVALARTIVQKPKAFLMDEPLSDLDAKLKVETRKEIQKVDKEMGKPVFYVTHDQEEAMTLSDRIAIMNDGRVEQIGTPKEVFHQPNSVFVGQFIGNYSMNMLDLHVNSVTNDSVSVTNGKNRIKLPVGDPGSLQSENGVVLGFRPENTTVHENLDEGDFNGTVTLTETFGERTVVTIDLDQGGTIDAVVDSDRVLSADSRVSISFNKDRAHLFDSDSGDVIVHTGTRKQLGSIEKEEGTSAKV
jgi:multiple sugar transport system ATP-binding protein